ncbi:MAG: membrane protein [Chloroflexi bacterium CSP1-4]|nr:MAG: membrane protein [Chloroflexi bacterium CSP1-4]
MNGIGRLSAYFALFSEIALVFLVTTLAGALAGHWLDGQLGTNPLLVLIGLLGGFGLGAIAVHRLVTRFLAKFED